MREGSSRGTTRRRTRTAAVRAGTRRSGVGGAVRSSAWMAVALTAALAPALAEAKLRLQSHRFKYVCRVVVTVDTGRTVRTIYDGPVRRGDIYTYRGREGHTVCMRRSEIPEVCESRLTPPQCMIDTSSNRTKLFSLR